MLTKDEIAKELDELVKKRDAAQDEAVAWALAKQTDKSKAAEMLADSFNKRIAELLAELADKLPG